MPKNLNVKKCSCGLEFKQYNTLQKYCSFQCGKINSKTKTIKPKLSIRKVSVKRQEINKIYSKIRLEILSAAGNKCFVEGCNNFANTIEHTAGRLGFYDEQSRYDNIPLIIDKRFLKACCLHHNLELENNTEMSKKYQLSKISGKPKE